MKKHHRISLLICILLFSVNTPSGQENDDQTLFYKFGAWKYLTAEQKSAFFEGFINGFFAPPRSTRFDPLAKCIEKNLSQDQGVKMITKYHDENPQRWDAPIPMGIVEALTVKDGPCPGKDPWTR